MCKICTKEYKENHYLQNKDHYREKNHVHKKALVLENKEKLLNFLKNHPCVDCKESDLRVLDFDHVRGKKIKGVSVLLMSGYSWNTIEKEIEKCEVRCANCHRKRTSDSLGHYKSFVS